MAHLELEIDKPARRLVLKLVDDEEKVADDLSLDSFIAGFQLAWQLSAEVNYRCESSPMVMKDYGQDEICPDEEFRIQQKGYLIQL